MAQSSKHIFTSVRKLTISLVLLLIMLVALYVTLGRQFILLINYYKDQLATTLSEQLHTPVTIGRLEGRWSIFSPIIKAHDVYIGNKEQNLKVEQLTIETNIPQSLLSRQFKVSAVHAEGLQLQVRENEPEQWSIGGIPKQKDPIIPEVIFTQLQRFEKISLSNSTIKVYPYQQISRTFTHVNATLKQPITNHLNLNGVLYLAKAKPFVIAMDAFILPKKWRKLDATLYTSIPSINWKNWLPDGLLGESWQLKQLKAEGEIWASIKKGQVEKATVVTQKNQLGMQYDKNKPFNIQDITFKAWFKNDGKHTRLQVDNLAFIADKTSFKDTALLVTHAKAATDKEQWQFKANTIDIGRFIAPVQALVPLPAIANEIINSMQPKGVLHNITVNWQPQKPLLEQLNFSANLENITFNPYKNTVGAGNITGSIEGGMSQGQLKLNTKDFSLFIADIYPKPWLYKTAKAALNWSFDGQTVSLYSPLMQLTGEEGVLAGDMMIRLYPEEEIKNYMDLRVNISKGDASYTPKYIPTKLKTVNPELIQWLNTSIKSGFIETGFFQYQGSIHKDTPPTAHTLLLYMKPRDAEINYQTPWLPIKKVSGEVFVEPSAVRVFADKGTVSNSQLTNIKVIISDLNIPKVNHLYLNTSISSDLNDTLNILKSAPPEISNVFKSWQGSGNLTGNLKLDIPLKKNQKPIVITEFTTNRAQLNLPHPALPLSQIMGSFHYDSSKGLSSDRITAYALGQPLQGSIIAEGKHGDPISHIKMAGAMDIKKLINWFTQKNQDWPATGKTSYQLNLWVGEQNRLKITSQLKGVDLDLPMPFTKEANQTQDFLWDMQFADQKETQLEAKYGNFITASMAMYPEQMETVRGEILLNQGKAALSSKKGLQIQGNLTKVNLEAWKQTIDTYLPTIESDKSTNKPFNINFLRRLDLRIGQVIGWGLPAQRAAIYLQPTGQQGWRLDINSQIVSGRITAPQMKGLPYYVNLKYLKIPTELSQTKQTNFSLNTFDTKKIPSVNLFVQKLFLGDDLLGIVHFKNSSTAQGLQLSNLSMNLKGLHVKGQLDWQIGKRTAFKGQLSGKNLAQILTNWKFDPSITTKNFKVNIDGSWTGTPADFSVESFSGLIDSKLVSGQLSIIDSSATNVLRIFGILNSDALRRRLRLDFSDLYKSGLSYDQIKGAFTASDGIFHTTKPLVLEGPSMLMSMNGQVNMRTQEINATLKAGIPIGSNLSIATLAVAPPIGGAMLVVDHFFGNELMKLAAVTYSIKGNWNDPAITLGH